MVYNLHMNFPYTYLKNISDNNLDQNYNLCVYLNSSYCECEHSFCLTLNNDLIINSFYSKIYMKDTSYQLDVNIRKIRTFLKQNFVQENENFYVNDDVCIELCVAPKLRDKNGVVIEKKYNSLFILIYSNYKIQDISFKEYKAKKPDFSVTANIELKDILEVFDMEKTFDICFSLLGEL